MNLKFVEYFRDNFFKEKEELDKFINSLTKRLTKTLRINTSKVNIIDLKKRLHTLWYILNPTFQDNVFYVEKSDNFDWLERRLGFSLEHLLWYFYIQELWASSSVYYLSNWKIDKNNYLILDMASSPGGKTTQLAEYYPNSFIVANEFDRNRTPQLIANIERMGIENYWITNYNWQFIWRQTELFDKILLDAPCSWEWTGFKSLEALKYRNIKNVKKVSELQKKLIEAWFNSLKIGWEMLYSTCTMNKLENEWVIEYLSAKHPWSFEIEFEKRFWPHIDETWWFYVCKIKKIKSIDYKTSEKPDLYNEKIIRLSKKDEEIINSYFHNIWLKRENYCLLKYWDKILSIWNKKSSVPYQNISNKLYFLKLWKEIGNIINSSFQPNFVLWRDYWTLKTSQYSIKNEQELDNYLRGFEIWKNLKWDKSSNIIQISFKETNIWLWEINEQWSIKNWFPKIWMRK